MKAKTVALICGTSNAWKVAEPSDPVAAVQEREVSLEIQGDPKNGYHLIMSPKGCFTPDSWHETVKDARRREKAQAEYVEDFLGAVVTFLSFHANYAALAQQMARAVTDHATPVGSGTVARTKRIPVEQRADAAVIAWMRHQTTGYDGMVIPKIKGKRREVRRMLAARSTELLERYRRGEVVGEECPLRKALITESTAGDTCPFQQ